MKVLAHAPGRVNLIGDHTDYTGGLVLPMAIDLGTTVELDRGGPVVELVSADDPDPAVVPVVTTGDPSRLRPAWARYVAGVVAVLDPGEGGRGFVRTTLPVGAGLSSSAALEVSVALALGFAGAPLELALACQQAEQLASGVPCGIMDQLASVAGREGHALLIDCASLAVTPVPLPDGLQVMVVDSGQRRALSDSAYGVRRAQAEEAAAILGPLRTATVADAEGLTDPVLRRRARHIVTENARVRAMARALRHGDAATAGQVMEESHASLRGDFEVSTSVLDELVDRLRRHPGVWGARLTGAGFGGCVVVLAGSGVVLPDGVGARVWPVQAAGGATVTALS